MSGRYTDREQALVEYLTAALDCNRYSVSRRLSLSNSFAGKPLIIGVRLADVTNDLERGLSEPAADTHAFIIRGFAQAGTDDTMNDALNEIMEDVINALRSVSSWGVFGQLGGAPVGWRVTRAVKGLVGNQPSVQIEVTMLVEEDSPAPYPMPAIRLGHNLGTVASGSVPFLFAVVVENTGTATLAINGATTSAGWSVIAPVPATIAAGAVGTLTVALTDAVPGAKEGDLYVDSTAGAMTFPLRAVVV